MGLEHKAKKKKAAEEPMEVDEALNGGNENQEHDNSFDDFDHISDDEEGGLRLGDIYIPPPPKPTLAFDAKGPRMIITHIKNHNFKSYAGTQTLGPFHKSFTSIIGPNGSGKSNVIDSMLFVFGYRASKIRSKKISVLIHSSSRFPNVTSATVEVHFAQIIDEEGDSFQIIPGSEIVVARTAFKDNSSFYQLNGKRVQFKEVSKMLRAYGIDLDHNRFLILQGEVEQIAMMKPKGQTENECGMLEYLEDIMGTKRYNKPLEIIESKIEVLNDQRKEKLNRVRMAEGEWQAFHEPCKTAVDLINRTNAAVKMRNWVLQKYIHESRKIVSAEEVVLGELKGVQTQIEEKLAKIQDELNEKKAVLSAGTEKYTELRRQKEEKSEKLQACKRKTVSVQADTGQSTKKMKNLQQLIDQEKGKLIELELIPEKNQREIEDCQRLLERHNESKQVAEQELQSAMEGVRARTEVYRNQRDELQNRCTELKDIVAAEINNQTVADSELRIYLSSQVELQQALQDLKDNYDKANSDTEQKQRTRDELMTSVPREEQEVASLQTQLQSVKEEEAGIVEEIRSLDSQLEESKQAMTDNRSRGRVLDILMREKRNGNMPGIFGRLGDLGGIDLKYDVAISTCCGALENIVVDTVDTGQACIELLRANNVGRATFIVLERQEHLKRQYEQRRTYPESVPRMFDLVTVRDPRVLPAFYYALRETLVANHLEQATRIAYGPTRYRVVTLNGEVIELSGTMAGGGKTVMRGRMGSSVLQDTSEQDPATLRAKERRLSELNERLPQVRSEQLRIEEALGRVTESASKGRNLLNKLNVELRDLAIMMPDLRRQIAEHELRVASVRIDPVKKARLEKKANEVKAKLDQARANVIELEAQVEEVTKLIAEQAGGTVRDLQKSVNDLTKKITKVTTEMTKLKVAINTSKRNATTSRNKITQMETDLSETVSNLENLKTQKKNLTLETAELQKALEELEEQINEGTSEFSGLKEEISKLQQKEDKRKGEKISAANAVAKKEKSLEEYRAREPAFRKDIQALKFEDPGVQDVPNLEVPEPFKTYTDEELEQCDLDELRKKYETLKSRLGDQKPNLKDIQEYKAKEENYMNKIQELEAITAERNRIRVFREEITKKRLNEFMTGFTVITQKLKEMYQMITLGGDGELECVDSLDPFTEGISFSVRPPNKSWKNITNLSGGEKTLSSLALVFALHYYKPTPLYVMDEIDAALDFKNVSIVANYIKERTKNAQFIIISLRYNMFEACHRLIGIFKVHDCTQAVCTENRLPENNNDDEEVERTL